MLLYPKRLLLAIEIAVRHAHLEMGLWQCLGCRAAMDVTIESHLDSIKTGCSQVCVGSVLTKACKVFATPALLLSRVTHFT
jgi:hypothetical protein